MKSTEGMTLTLTRHACKQAVEKGFTPEAIQECFANPKKVYPSGSHPGQFRVVNKDICIVGVPVSNTEFRGITMYVNGTLTPPRKDQMDTEEGRRYAKRYADGLGRG
jgi:hypothetical protein